ncbi:MAG: hypothetical protein QM538_05905 [Methylacidiphilales bacterium]|nr:hypothetical protein [Candidatus Methylacidiphilales bacterium]
MQNIFPSSIITKSILLVITVITVNFPSEAVSQETQYHVFGVALERNIARIDTLSILAGRYSSIGRNTRHYSGFDETTDDFRSLFYSYLYLSESQIGFEFTLESFRNSRSYCNYEYEKTSICPDYGIFDEKTLFDEKTISVLFGVNTNTFISIDFEYDKDFIVFKFMDPHRENGITYGLESERKRYFYTEKVGHSSVFNPDGIGIGMRYLFPDDSLYIGWSLVSYKKSVEPYLVNYYYDNNIFFKYKYYYSFSLKIGWIIN